MPLAFSLAYSAPQVVAAYAAGASRIVADKAADVWSLGVIAFELLTGALAFDNTFSREQVIAALVGETQLPWETASAATLKSLRKLKGPILQCLSREPSERPTAAEFAGAVEHTCLPAATTVPAGSAAASVSSASTAAATAGSITVDRVAEMRHGRLDGDAAMPQVPAPGTTVATAGTTTAAAPEQSSATALDCCPAGAAEAQAVRADSRVLRAAASMGAQQAFEPSTSAKHTFDAVPAKPEATVDSTDVPEPSVSATL